MTQVVEKGRPFDVDTVLAQIGRWNVGAISGGRVYIDGESYNASSKTTQQIELPVGYGYRVRILLGWDDTYTVQRVIVKNTKNGIKETIKGSVEGVYCDQVGEVAYQASCFRSNETFGKVVA
jgi:hypothetical protein